MWEMTIVGNVEDKQYFDDLESVLVASKYSSSIIVSTVVDRGECICSVASIHSDTAIVDYIRVEIVKTILSITKREYFLAKLHISSVGEDLLRFLVDVLVSVDSEYEIYYILSRLVSSRVVLRSFVRFCLKDVVYKWDRLCHTLSVELSKLSPYEVYLDILKFVVDMTSTRDMIVAIDVVDEHYVLQDADGRVLDNIPIVSDVDMIVRLINHQPSQVQVRNVSMLPKNIYAVFRYIFSDRLQVLI